MAETVTKSLRYDFTDAQQHDLALNLAAHTKEIKVVTDEKKSSNAKFNSALKRLREVAQDLSIKIADGYEYQDVNCHVEYHKPSQGQMTVTRTDTGEVFTEQMTENDWNLFNQV